jgi:hypothetical protein
VCAKACQSSELTACARVRPCELHPSAPTGSPARAGDMNSDLAVGTAIAALLARPDPVGDADAFIRAECAKAHRVAPEEVCVVASVRCGWMQWRWDGWMDGWMIASIHA